MFFMEGYQKITDLINEKSLLLAPMAGVADNVFRRICTGFGADIVFTEMVSAQAITYNNRKTFELLAAPGENNIAMQIFGKDPEIIYEAIKITDRLPFLFYDLNCGCPAKKIVTNGEGSALMKDPDLIGKIINKMTRATKKPVTIKIRKGFSEENAEKVAKIAEYSGASMVTIHGRTREEQYAGKCDLRAIKRVVEAVKIPVVGNGDVVDFLSYKKMKEETGCYAVMIGRGAYGNPFVFEDIKSGKILSGILPKDKIKMALEHAKQIYELEPEYSIGMIRKHVCEYTRGIKGGAEVRGKVVKAEDYFEVAGILEEFMENFL